MRISCCLDQVSPEDWPCTRVFALQCNPPQEDLCTLAATSSVRVLILPLTLSVRWFICPRTKSSRSRCSSRSSRQQILSEVRGQTGTHSDETQWISLLSSLPVSRGDVNGVHDGFDGLGDLPRSHCVLLELGPDRRLRDELLQEQRSSLTTSVPNGDSLI